MTRNRLGLIMLSLICCTGILSGCFGAHFVKVGNTKLTVSNLDKRFAAAEAAYTELGWALNEEQRQDLKVLVAQNLIMHEVAKRDNKANKWKTNTAEIKQDIQDRKDEQGEDSFKKNLAGIGLTEKQFQQIVAHRYYVTKDITVSEEDLQQFFGDNLSNPEYQVFSESVTARHILVATEEEAREVKRRIDAGEDFAALALEKSIEETTKNNGGLVGDFVRGVMKPEFEDAAFALQAGEVSQPVKMENGYHIIKVTDRKAAATMEDFENHRELIEEDALRKKKDATYDALYRELLVKNSVEFAPGYENLSYDH
jgi:parvulin-like peptidyl-prolyl isomerase